MINQSFDFITIFHRIIQLFLSQKQRAKSPPVFPYEVEINKYDSGRNWPIFGTLFDLWNDLEIEPQKLFKRL